MSPRKKKVRAEWVRGTRMFLDHCSPILLRLKDGKVEASNGYSIPTARFKQLWKKIQRLREKHNRRPFSFVCTSMDFRVWVYPGSVQVGCTVVPWPQVVKIARKLELVQ